MAFKEVGSDKLWEPTPKQEEFLRIPDSIPEALFGGAAAGGKTELLVLLPILREWHRHPAFRGIIFRRTFPQVEEALEPVTKHYYEPLGATYNSTKHLWRFPSGATIRFGYSDDPDDIRQHDSAEYHYIAFDEVTHFEPFQYLYMLSRNRTTYKELPAVIRAATNPGGIGHTFFRDRFVKPAPYGNRLIEDSKGNKRIYIHATVYDNPHVENREQYIRGLEQLPEAEKKAKLDGDWFSFEGQVFSEFRERHYEGEPENALHIIPAFTIPTYWPKVLSIDWGYTAMVCAHWSAVAPDGRVYFYREYTAKKTSIKNWGSDIGRLASLDDGLVLTTMDPSAWKEEGHEKTIAEQFMESSGLMVEKADNARIAGKMNYHDFLRWVPKPPRFTPKTGYDEMEWMRIYRMYGEKRAGEYKAMFLPEPPETNIPRMQIFAGKCPELVKVIPLLVYDERRTEDVMAFDGDDPYDCSRYNLMAVDRYVRQCAEDFERMRQLDEIIQAKDAGRIDQTAFYRRMEQYESTVNGPGQPVQRGHARFGIASRVN